MEDLKWQIHVETSAIQILLWLIVSQVFYDKFVFIFSMVFIFGNILTLIKATARLPKGYLK